MWIYLQLHKFLKTNTHSCTPLGGWLGAGTSTQQPPAQLEPHPSADGKHTHTHTHTHLPPKDVEPLLQWLGAGTSTQQPPAQLEPHPSAADGKHTHTHGLHGLPQDVWLWSGAGTSTATTCPSRCPPHASALVQGWFFPFSTHAQVGLVEAGGSRTFL